MQTYAQFKDKIKRIAFPAGEPANLVSGHDAMFETGMVHVQQCVPCLQEFNTSTYASAVRQWDGSKTRVEMPKGRIRRVYTVAGGLDRWRDKVYYRSSNITELECWSRNLVDAVTPPLPDLGYGVRAENVASDWEAGRARQGIWAHYRGYLYLAPWLQTYELLVVVWDGEKPEWQASDVVNRLIWTKDAENVMLLYLKWQHELHYGDISIAGVLEKQFDKALAWLIHMCRENTKQRPDEICASEGRTFDQVPSGTDGGLDEDDDDPTEDTTEQDEVLFNAVGDLGDPGTNTDAVAAAVIADNPEIFFALGDLTYNDDFAADFGVNYQSFLDAENVVPVPGNHDVIGGDLDAFKAYFDAVIGNNGQNYEVAFGPLHILVYNSEDTGNIDVNSAQAEWLRAKLLLSTARWKIVLMHRPPFSSGTTHGSTAALQLPFKAWGADVVLAGHEHNYERIVTDDFPYIVVGTGGRPLYPFGAAVAGSAFRNNTTYGRLIGEVTCDSMILSYKTVDGTVLDTYTITKD